MFSEVSKYYDFTAEKEAMVKESDNWWNRKLFNEHLVQLQGDNYWFTFDPIFDLQVGKDSEAEFNSTFNNTRGFYVQGGIGKNLSFSASVYESQGRFADYFNRYSETLKAFGPDRTSFYWYGVMKANSERIATETFGAERTINVRPTYMFGPADKTNRFIHWPLRLAKGGEVLVPGKPNDPVQYVDVRDVAEFMIRLAEDQKAGTYNAVGPKEAQNMYSFVEEASTAFDVEHTFVKIDDYDFLKEQNVYFIVPWIMPTDEYLASALISNKKAIDAGLTFRSLKDTVKDTFVWWYSDGLTDEQRESFEENPNASINVEQKVLEAWKEVSK